MSAATNDAAERQRPFFGIDAIAAATAVECADREVIEHLFDGLSEPTAAELIRETTRYLADHGQRTGRWKPWAEVAWLLPHSWGREATQQAQARFDIRARALNPEPSNRPKDQRRSEIAKAALRLIRAKYSAREIMDRVRSLNATFDRPLPDETVSKTIVWAAEKVGGPSHAV